MNLRDLEWEFDRLRDLVVDEERKLPEHRAWVQYELEPEQDGIAADAQRLRHRLRELGPPPAAGRENVAVVDPALIAAFTAAAGYLARIGREWDELQARKVNTDLAVLRAACTTLEAAFGELDAPWKPPHEPLAATRKVRALELFLHRDMPEKLDGLSWNEAEADTLQRHGVCREAPVPGVPFNDELHILLGQDTTREGVELPAGSVLSCTEPGYYMTDAASIGEAREPTFILRKATVILVAGTPRGKP